MGTRFHELLRRHLEAQGRSYYWLQEQLDISTSLSTLWKKSVPEGGRRPSVADIAKLADFKELGLSQDTLMGWRATDEYSLSELKEAVRSWLDF